MRRTHRGGRATFILVTLGLAGLAGHLAVSAAPYHGPARQGTTATPALIPFEDQPIAVDAGPDGSVWVLLRTTSNSAGAAAQFSADLVLRHQWRFTQLPVGLAAHPNGDIYLNHWRPQGNFPGTTIIRRTGNGLSVHSWPVDNAPAGLDAGADGTLHVLTGATAPESWRVFQFAADGTPLSDWVVGRGVLAVAAAPGGDVILGLAAQAGATPIPGEVARYDGDGVRRAGWAVPGRLTGVDVAPDGRVFVAFQPAEAVFGRVEAFTADGQSQIAWNVPGSVGENSSAQVGDIAVGAGGDVYVLAQVLLNRLDRRGRPFSVLYRYSAEGELLNVRRDFSVGPATATPLPSATERRGRTATPRPGTASATATPTGTPVPTASATASVPPTPTVTDTPSPVPSPTLCPPQTPETLLVDPVQSPTKARSLVIRARLGSGAFGEWIEVEAPLGTFRKPGGDVAIEVPLVPNRTNAMVVRGRVMRTEGPNGCVYGAYELRRGLVIEQIDPIFLPAISNGL